MAQRHLPVFADGMEPITSELAFEKRDGQVTQDDRIKKPFIIQMERDVRLFSFADSTLKCIVVQAAMAAM